METVGSDRMFRLRARAHQVRLNAVQMAVVHGQGYIAQALGVADVLTAVYLDSMRVRPAEPNWPERDRFLLSVGHYAIAHYAILAEAGFISQEELPTYGADGSRLPMSGMVNYTPGAEMSGGSIGLGLPMAVGMALGLKRKQTQSFVYTLMGDGEMAEGPTWEAAAAASNFHLGNIIGIVDVNGVQADGPTHQTFRTEPLDQKFRAFGFHTQRVDGNDMAALLDAFQTARSVTDDVPRVVICDTKMGKGVDFLEAREKNHFIRLEASEWEAVYRCLESVAEAA